MTLEGAVVHFPLEGAVVFFIFPPEGVVVLLNFPPEGVLLNPPLQPSLTKDTAVSEISG